MKICIFSPMIYPVPAVHGGAVEGLIELLVRVNEDKQGCELTVISVYGEEAVRKSKEYKHTKFIFIKRDNIYDKLLSSKLFLYINLISLRLRNKILFSMPYVKRAWKSVSKENFDYYMVEGGGDYYNFGYLAKKIEKGKLGVHFHGEMKGDIALNKWFGSYITVSNFIARKLICNGVIDSTKVHILHNCYDELSMTTKTSSKDVRKQYGFKETDYIFVYWGRLIPEKGLVPLIEAYIKVRSTHSNAKLLVIGNAHFGFGIKTEFDSVLENICKEEVKLANIVFTGFISHDLMGSILGACDTGIVPSLWDDPAPLTVFEGFSKGLPMIVSNSGGIPEIIKNYENAIMIGWSKNFSIDLARAMSSLIENIELRKKLSQQCQKDIKLFNQNNYYKNYISIIKSILTTGGKDEKR